MLHAVNTIPFKPWSKYEALSFSWSRVPGQLMNVNPIFTLF